MTDKEARKENVVEKSLLRILIKRKEDVKNRKCTITDTSDVEINVSAKNLVLLKGQKVSLRTRLIHAIRN